MRPVPAVLGPVLALALAACGGSPATSGTRSAGPSTTHSITLTVYAAASLGSAMTRIASAYRAAHPGISLTVSTDSSAALETKIEQGAPADLFLSADTTNPQRLIDAGLAAGRQVTPFAGNLLTVIVPADNPARVGSPADLAKSGVKIVAAGDAVPITKYATRLVAHLASLPGYPADFAARYAANVVSREDSVAAVVAKVALGEGDAAIVYGTDARASAEVRSIPVPTEANVPATYGGVVLLDSADTAAASAFLGWLAGPDGQAILASFGFLPPS